MRPARVLSTLVLCLNTRGALALATEVPGASTLAFIYSLQHSPFARVQADQTFATSDLSRTPTHNDRIPLLRHGPEAQHNASIDQDGSKCSTEERSTDAIAHISVPAKPPIGSRADASPMSHATVVSTMVTTVIAALVLVDMFYELLVLLVYLVERAPRTLDVVRAQTTTLSRKMTVAWAG